MENILLPGSNTLANVLALAEGNALHFTLMPDGNGNVSLLLKPVALKNGKVVKELPVLEGTLSLGNIDAEFTAEVYRIFQGEFAQATHTVIDYHRALEKEVATTQKPAAAIVKPGEAMPPPTGRRAATEDEIKLANEKGKKPAVPAKPAPPKPGVSVVESDGTGANAPAKPNPKASPDATNDVPVTAGSEPLIEDVVAVPVTAEAEEDLGF